MRILDKQKLEREIRSLFRHLQKEEAGNISEARFNTALTEVLENHELDTNGDPKRHVSVLVCDIRGFTPIVENVATSTVVKILNVFFSTMVAIINRHGGQVNKFMGDSLIAFFDSADNITASVRNVLICSIEMQIAMDEVNRASRELGMNDLYMGIGINSGDVVASFFGSDIYREFTIIGTTVNIASRLEAYTLRGQILLSDKTRQYASDFIETGSRNEVIAKGLSEPLCFYELLAVKEPALLELPRRDNRTAPRIRITIPVSYQLLDGKNILREVYEAETVDISYGGMMINANVPIEQFSDIKLSVLLSPLAKEPIDLYAKAVYVQGNEQGMEVGLEFTIIDDSTSAKVKYYVDNMI